MTDQTPRLCEEPEPPQIPGALLAHCGGSPPHTHLQGPLSPGTALGLPDAGLLEASVSSSVKWNSTLEGTRRLYTSRPVKGSKTHQSKTVG